MDEAAELQYYVNFGKGDGSEMLEWGVELTDEEAEEYARAMKLRISPNELGLDSALSRAYAEIEAQELENALELGDEFAMECTGRIPVDAGRLNELVAARDRHTLEFFGLAELSDAELKQWDAGRLDKLPLVRDFDADFVPSSPFDSGWGLSVEFSEYMLEEDLEDEEAREALEMLFGEADGDFSGILDYIDRCDGLYIGDSSLEDLAEEIAGELGIEGFSCSGD